MRHDPVRWVCQCRSSICDGTFYVYSEARPCPLWKYCQGNSNQLEYLYPQQSIYQRKLRLAEPERCLPHAKRLLDLRKAFVPDDVKRLNRAHYERNKERYAAIAARKYAEAHLEQVHNKPPKYDIPLPPCGRVCEEEEGGWCPYDDECRYADWDEQQIAAIKEAEAEQRRERNKARRRAWYADLKTDPERYAAHLAKQAEWKREKRGAAQENKPPETPEQKEARLAAAKEHARERDRLSQAKRMTDPAYAEQYRAKKREQRAKRRANMTPEQIEAKRAQGREWYHAARAAETPEEREARIIKAREKTAAMTPEQRETERAKRREQDRRRRENETPEHREARLARERETRRAREAAMTPEQREEKNAKQRARYWIRNYAQVCEREEKANHET